MSYDNNRCMGVVDVEGFQAICVDSLGVLW